MITNPLTVALIQFAVKFGMDAALILVRNLKNAATIDDVIAALEAAEKKSAQDYIDEAKSKLLNT